MSIATPARLLAFDTSTEVLAVAAAGPLGAHAVNAPGGAAASAQLVPLIEEVLARAGLAFADLDAIAFGRGPGAFTGLRTSCAVAQGLGFGLERPLVPLDSLLVVAEDAFGIADELPAPATVAVAMDARMDEVYGAVYERIGGPATPVGAAGWRALHAPALYTLASWNAQVDAVAALHGLAGSALAAFGARLSSPAGAIVRSGETDRASALLRLAQRAFAAGEGIDAAQALPLYLRDKVALTTAERAARAANAAGASGGTDAARAAGQPARAAHGG